jgi:dipeptidyl aminopeptidase/acylaminoacyl peptidase
MDANKDARFAWGEDLKNRQKVYYRAGKGKDWELVNDEHTSGRRLYPQHFAPDGSKVYVQVTEKTGPDSMQTWDVATRKLTPLVRDDDTDPQGLLLSADGRTPYAVFFMDGLPRAHVFAPEVPEAKLRATLAQSFPGHWVTITSYTKDEQKLVFRVASDRNPGEFYLFDRGAKKATYLLSRAEWIDPEQMAEMKPIKYVARDGRTIHGYLTLPRGMDKNLPLILNPHGGPIGVSEAWGYNSEVQLFANRGYAVLQIDYRGSGNHGDEFMKAGYRKWGTGMIDDMTDAVAWAVKQGYVDKDRVCIYGASYGGYAAAQAVVREPDLYKCAVGYVGVYDLPMMYTRGDVRNRDAGTNYLEEAMGTGREFLVANSPARNADKIKVPVFLIAGKEDFRAHPDHSRAMRDALQKVGKLHEYIEKEYEGHGFFKEENNRELYTKMVAFFDKYTGNTAGQAAAVAGQ